MKRPVCIAIDGPVAAGKSVVGRLVAQRLGYRFLDTGLMYRAVTWLALQQSVDPDDAPALGRLAEGMSLDWDEAACDGSQPGWTRRSAPTSESDLHSAAVDANVSRVSRHATVRRILVGRQRDWAAGGGAVVVGRDIGTVVLPEAPLKIYLVASPAERARRRWLERRVTDAAVDPTAMQADIEARDAFDSTRELAPLRPAADAVTLDTDGLSPEAVAERILALAGDP
ncbi:MAG: (d)CMP kinase [Chloroflexi bacterium]|nr:(d)CMP kinase [Chloroflexota bacterium]